MSGTPSSAPTGVPAPRPEDPTGGATADKRTLIIAVVVMFSLVLVGVVSGALFNRSPCATIDPDPVDVGLAGTAASVEGVLAAAFPDGDAATRDGMRGALESLARQLGPISGIAEVTGAHALGATGSGAGGDGATSGGVAALGPVTSLLDPGGSAVSARVDVGDGVVIGSGETLYSVAAANELTGQVDAAIPLDGALEAGTCVNTSLINSPLAFALDAGDGELLLLRINEDGGEPELELRDAEQGRVWGPPLDIGIAQPGVQGQRLSARLGPETVVAGHRTTLGDGLTVLTAVDRGTGETDWSLDRDGLDGLLATEFPQYVEVVAVGDEVAIVSIVADPQLDELEAQAAVQVPTRIVALELADGSVRWDAALEPGAVVRDAVLRDGRLLTVVADPDDGVRVEVRDADGAVTSSAGTLGEDGRVALSDDGRSVAVTPTAVILDVVGDHDADHGGEDGGDHGGEDGGEDEVLSLASGLIGRDVITVGGGVSMLFEGPDGGSIVVTFGG